MMGEAKYGRLFTKRDILAILDEISALELTADTADATLDRLIRGAEGDKGPMTFPVDEPLFLLRASDGECAADAVAAFGRGRPMPPPMVKGVLRTDDHTHAMAERVRIANAYDAMRTWER